MDRQHRSVVKELYDPRARHLIDLEHSERIIERELTFRHQIVYCHQYRDLDQTGGRKSLIPTSADARAGLEIDDGVADDAVMRVSDRVELLAQSCCVGMNALQTIS